jgi:hypothetical protein
MTRLMDGRDVELLPPGTRVRHKEHPELTGELVCWEYHESGLVSAIPYKVYWDDQARANAMLGILSIYQLDSQVEAVPA